MSAVSFAVFFYIPFKHQGLKARKPLRIAVREPTLVGARLPPCALPHLTELGERVLGAVCLTLVNGSGIQLGSKHDGVWGRGGGETRERLSHSSPGPVFLPQAAVYRVREYPQARSRSRAHAAAKWGSPREARNIS